MQYAISVKNLSDMTIKSYRSDLKLFCDYLSQNGFDIETLNRRQARMFIGFVKRTGHKASSANRILSTMRGYYEYLVRFKNCDYNPFNGLKSLKKKKLLPDFLFEDEIRKLLNFSAENFAQCRDKLIFELLYSTGCRVSEICSIDLKDVNKEDNSIMVTGKGRKSRLVFIGRKACEALNDYLPFRKQILSRYDEGKEKPGGALIVNKNGGRMTQRGLSYIIKKWVLACGINKKVSPHTFRHTFATHLLDKGADIRTVQEMLGHACLSTTQIYAHVGMDRLKKAYMAAHPHAGQKRT